MTQSEQFCSPFGQADFWGPVLNMMGVNQEYSNILESHYLRAQSEIFNGFLAVINKRLADLRYQGNVSERIIIE